MKKEHKVKFSFNDKSLFDQVYPKGESTSHVTIVTLNLRININFVSDNIARYHLVQDLEMCQYRLCIGDSKVTRNLFNNKR